MEIYNIYLLNFHHKYKNHQLSSELAMDSCGVELPLHPEVHWFHEISELSLHPEVYQQFHEILEYERRWYFLPFVGNIWQNYFKVWVWIIFCKWTYFNTYYDKAYRNSSIEKGLHDNDVECLLFKYHFILYRYSDYLKFNLSIKIKQCYLDYCTTHNFLFILPF